MPLLDLQTDLKSLKFGRDRFNGGSSNQPYIQKSIPEELFPTSTDFLLHNGFLERSLTDSSRLVSFLTDTKSFQGAAFIVKQELLSRQNPIVQGQPNRRSPSKGLYNPLNTLLQVGGSGTGLHVEKQGLLPISDDRSKYFTSVKNLGGPNSNNSDANRLVLLYKRKIQDLSPLTVEGNAAFKAYQINDTSPTTLLSYSGGASGLGSTDIKIYDKTVSEQNLPNGVSLSTYQVGRGPFFGRGGLKIDENGLKFTGATSAYFTYTEINGELIPDPSREEIEKFTGINEEGGQLKPYGPLDDNSTLSTNTKDLDLKTYQTGLRNTGTLNFTGSLGASKNQGLNDLQTGVNSVDNQRRPGNLIGVTNVSESLAINSNPIIPENAGALNFTGSLGASKNQGLNDSQTGVNSRDNQRNPGSLIGVTNVSESLAINSNITSPKNAGTLNFTGSLGASKAQGLTDNQTGINSVDNQRNPGSLVGVTNVSQSLTKPTGSRNSNLPNIFDNRTDKISGEKVRKLPSYRTYKIKDEVTTSPITNSPQDSIASQQIIKFFFELLNNDAAGSSEYIYFRAYLDNLSDGFSSEWQSVKYTGRAENFYQYKGFDRSISLGFSIYAGQPSELPSIYEKLNALAGMCAPDYSNLGYMRGNIVRITIGDYIQSLPCAIKGFKIDGLIENGGWGIEEGAQNPRYLKIGGMDLLPIHDFVPERGAEFFKTPTDFSIPS